MNIFSSCRHRGQNVNNSESLEIEKQRYSDKIVGYALFGIVGVSTFGFSSASVFQCINEGDYNNLYKGCIGIFIGCSIWCGPKLVDIITCKFLRTQTVF